MVLVMWVARRTGQGFLAWTVGTVSDDAAAAEKELGRSPHMRGQP